MSIEGGQVRSGIRAPEDLMILREKLPWHCTAVKGRAPSMGTGAASNHGPTLFARAPYSANSYWLR
ncbi:MAG: carbon storage regulator [Sedimenticolaceae bacterium]